MNKIVLNFSVLLILMLQSCVSPKEKTSEEETIDGAKIERPEYEFDGNDELKVLREYIKEKGLMKFPYMLDSIPYSKYRCYCSDIRGILPDTSKHFVVFVNEPCGNGIITVYIIDKRGMRIGHRQPSIIYGYDTYETTEAYIMKDEYAVVEEDLSFKSIWDELMICHLRNDGQRFNPIMDDFEGDYVMLDTALLVYTRKCAKGNIDSDGNLAFLPIDTMSFPKEYYTDTIITKGIKYDWKEMPEIPADSILGIQNLIRDKALRFNIKEQISPYLK